MEELRTVYTIEDLKAAAGQLRNFYGIPVIEKDLTTNEERLEKYLALKDLVGFIESFSEGQPEAAEIFKNKCALSKIARRNVREGQQPLEYSSDEDFL